MKIVIAAGGTGGHLYPGIAVAREILREKGNEVLFVGTLMGIEAKVLPKLGLPVRYISAGRLKGMGIAAVLKTLITLPKSFIQSFLLLRTERPDMVVGVGGYASGPVAAASWALRIPILVVEPNSYAGLANRLAGRFARRVVLTFPGNDRQNFFPAAKKIFLGPLVRNGINKGDRTKAISSFGLEADRFTVFVMGGSGGAHAINMAMKDAAPLLSDIRALQILHQTGEADVAEVTESYRKAGVKAKVLPFIHDMENAYAAADLVISRSGATTVAELAVCGKQAVLIPYPYAADNHQEYNARTLAERGQAEIILQKELTPGKLAEKIRLRCESGAADVTPLPDTAAEEIARLCAKYVQKN